MSSDYTYLAEVWPGDSTDAPSGLWRTLDDTTEYLSLIDWQWHPGAEEFARLTPAVLAEITPEQAGQLQSDRQRFVRYWSYQHPHSAGFPEKESRVYRRRASPERSVEEVFGPSNEWIPTGLITEPAIGSPGDRRDFIAIDRDAAEQLIQQTRGITGATDL